VDRLISYGEKAQGILKRYKDAPAPAGTAASDWNGKSHRRWKATRMDRLHSTIGFQRSLSGQGGGQAGGASGTVCTDLSGFTVCESGARVAATSYQQAQNTPKMLEVANGLLAKDPNNLGMLLLLSDYYCDKTINSGSRTYAKKSVSLLDAAPKPEGLADEQWAQQKSLQKGLALSSLGQVNIEKKENAQAVENLRAAAPLLKPDDGATRETSIVWDLRC